MGCSDPARQGSCHHVSGARSGGEERTRVHGDGERIVRLHGLPDGLSEGWGRFHGPANRATGIALISGPCRAVFSGRYSHARAAGLDMQRPSILTFLFLAEMFPQRHVPETSRMIIWGMTELLKTGSKRPGIGASHGRETHARCVMQVGRCSRVYESVSPAHYDPACLQECLGPIRQSCPKAATARCVPGP